MCADPRLLARSQATPAAVVAHTPQRGAYDYIVDQFLDGGAVAFNSTPQNFSWTQWDGPDVLFGGGGKDFVPKTSNGNVSKIDRFVDRGYQFSTTNASLHELDNSKRALGLFSDSNLPTWLDRHVYTDNLADFGAWNSDNKTFSAPTTDVPGLKDMTLKVRPRARVELRRANTDFSPRRRPSTSSTLAPRPTARPS